MSNNSSSSSTSNPHPLAAALKKGFSGKNLEQFKHEGYCILRDVLDVKAAQNYLDDIKLAFDPKSAIPSDTTSKKNAVVTPSSSPFGRF